MTGPSTRLVRRGEKWACTSWSAAIDLANERAALTGLRAKVYRHRGMWVVGVVPA